MKTKVNHTMVGLFVLGAVAIGIIALLNLGGVHFFSKPQRFEVTFNESIHGLDLGSAVKLRGVAVGRVVDIGVRYDEAANRSIVRVLCELNRNRIGDATGGELDVSNREALQHLVDKGLRAQLGIVGLATGLLFVELDFVDPTEVPAAPVAPDAAYVVVPAMPSTIAGLQSNLDAVLDNLAKVDFAGISGELKLLLGDARRQLASVDLRSLASQWERTGATIDALARDPKLQSTLANINTITASVERLLTRIDAQIVANGAELQATLREAQTTVKTFNETAQTIDRFVQSQRGLGDDVTTALRQLSDAAVSVQRLAEFLERNPNALILGRKLEK